MIGLIIWLMLVETILLKPTFKYVFKARPCLIPASGFYEWCEQQPYYFYPQGQLLAIVILITSMFINTINYQLEIFAQVFLVD